MSQGKEADQKEVPEKKNRIKQFRTISPGGSH